MAQSTTNLGKIHVFPSETLYNQFKDIIADNDLALLKDDGAYIVAALLEQNGYVKFSNGLILQWGFGDKYVNKYSIATLPIAFSNVDYALMITNRNLSAGTYISGAALSTTQIKVWNGGYSDRYYFFAIGW